ncbi:schwannomin-interacting protein 1 domain-containing protein [Phthorimaea operculella]|nr:schwannomin-interacting protein 1 domain-containing protein [Phthorimaea operculella]
MRLLHVAENGNVAALNPRPVASHDHFDNSSWLSNTIDSRNIVYNNTARTDNSLYNYNTYNTRESDRDTSNITIDNYTSKKDDIDSNAVCNRQYRLNTEANTNFLKPCDITQTANLEGGTERAFASRESLLDDTNVSSSTTPVDEERAFEHSDTDEMSDHSSRPVPRGIVNPNYPGFQHLAHTLQDYSANIDSYYHSENEMTDDDIDIEITDITCDSESNNKISEDSRDIILNDNNNGNNEEDTATKQSIMSTHQKFVKEIESLDSSQREIPDLLKTVSLSNNNNNSTEFDLNCSDADIENNFHTNDIIGDFNKEIEDEIKQLLNYNINIEDDLEELRKDIQDTFAKPIEDTINNISEVVNHVIKQLVETQVATTEDNTDKENNIPVEPDKLPEEINKDVNEQNKSNTRTEMKLSRPTFLLLENKTDGIIPDAFLSDGKDEIHVQYEKEYDTEALSNNVERTIRQLSTELRKIIPKLDEMRENDRIWNKSKNETDLVLTDGNSNEIASTSKCSSLSATSSTDFKSVNNKGFANKIADTAVKKLPVARIEPRASRERPKEITSAKSFRSAQSNTSVRKSESARECDLGSFDVYNIETALPKLDFDAIESHLKAAKEAERRMFESLVTNIKRRFSKTSEDIGDRGDTVEKTGFKRGLHLLKLKLSKSEATKLPVNPCDNLALSPRAVGFAECAETEIEWPALTDNNPNILDKFTRIVTIARDENYDQRKRNDREEIRKRLAMGADSEEYYSMGHIDRPGRKPSLHSRLQNGKNLQICFMNETASDNESQASDVEKNFNQNTKSLSRSSIFQKSNFNHPYQTRPLSVNITKHDKISTVQSGAKLRPSSLTTKTPKSRSTHSLGHIELKESDFYALQATLQTEARIALAQAKEMARIQMERERRSRPVSPVTEMLRRSMEKANAPLAADRRRVSRQLLTDMNIAQLQVIVNELHSEIERLNEQLVQMLMARDELHMGQDSMLVDIEDLTRYLGVKEQTKKTKGPAKTGVRRLASLVHK